MGTLPRPFRLFQLRTSRARESSRFSRRKRPRRRVFYTTARPKVPAVGSLKPRRPLHRLQLLSSNWSIHSDHPRTYCINVQYAIRRISLTPGRPADTRHMMWSGKVRGDLLVVEVRDPELNRSVRVATIIAKIHTANSCHRCSTRPWSR